MTLTERDLREFIAGEVADALAEADLSLDDRSALARMAIDLAAGEVERMAGEPRLRALQKPPVAAAFLRTFTDRFRAKFMP